MYVFGCGLLSGGLASCITQPFDVIKTSQQVSKDKVSLIDAIILINQVLVHIFFINSNSQLFNYFQKYGITGYFRGLSLRILRRSLMAAMTWTVYEKFSYI